MKYCINCGRGIPDAAKFCGVCGTQQVEDVVASASRGFVENKNEGQVNNQNHISDRMNYKTKKCPYCANIVNAEATICKHCNKRLNNSDVAINGIDIRKLCIALTFVIELVMLYFMFMPYVTLSYDMSFLGSGKIFDVNIFSGFEAAELIDDVESVTGKSHVYDTGEASGTFVFISIIGVGIVVLGIVLYVNYLKQFNNFFTSAPNWNINTYKPVAPILYVIMAFMFKAVIPRIFDGNSLGYIRVTLCSGTTIIIVLAILQIVIDIWLMRTEADEVREIADNGWQCSHCGTHNSPNVFYCEFCDRKRNSNKL